MSVGRVGDYNLLGVLGEGGVAIVYIARRDGAPELCALKVIRPQLVKDKGVRGRFEREAEIGALLEHPNTVRVLRSHVQEDPPHLALELIAGLDLEELSGLLRAKERLLPYPVTLSVLCDALDALGRAHAQGVIHRDLSPKNLMLAFDGRTKVIDFGAAKASVGAFRTTPGSEMGTMLYLSPEIAAGEPPGPPADVYSVAAIAYTLLCGTPPIAEKKAPLDTLKAILEEVPVPLQARNAEIPEPLARVIERGLAKRARDRYPSAPAFADALRAAQPSWCEIRQPELARFLSAWFPEQAQAFAALRTPVEQPPIELEEALTTVMTVPGAALGAEATAVWIPELVEEKSGLTFPRTDQRPAPRPRSPAALVAALAALTLLGASVGALLIAQPEAPPTIIPVEAPTNALPPPKPPEIVAAPAEVVVAPAAPAPSAASPRRSPSAPSHPIPRPAPSASATSVARPPSPWIAFLAAVEAYAGRPSPAEHDRLIGEAKGILARLPPGQRGQLGPAWERAELDSSADALRALGRLGADLDRRATSP